MKKMRVLALTTSYPLHSEGCAGAFVQNLYRSLTIACAIDVICPADSTAMNPSFRDEAGADIRVHAVRYAPRGWRTLAQGSGGVISSMRRAPWRVSLLPALLIALFGRCLLRAGEADLIHANWAVCGAIAGFAGRLRRKPVITTLRGDDVSRAASSWLDRAILAAAIRSSRKVVCVSEPMADLLRCTFPRRAADIHVCLNGVDEAFFAVQKTSPAQDPLRVLTVGSMIRRKGFDVLINAVARARHREHMRVRLIGDGPERESLMALARSLGVSSLIEFGGTVPPIEMPERFSLADVLVLSSRSEGRPNVVIEAVASGLPVISTNLEGVRGMVKDGDNGWLVAVDDADALANALDQAIAGRDELRRRGERSRQIARDHICTWADAARCYEALFRTVPLPNGSGIPRCAE